jgi:putative transcription factor
MTQKELAQKINVKPAIINDYESGKAVPDSKIINKIKKILNF